MKFGMVSRVLTGSALLLVVGAWINQTFNSDGADASETAFLQAYRGVAKGDDAQFSEADRVLLRALQIAEENYVLDIPQGRLIGDAMVALEAMGDDLTGRPPREVVELVLDDVFTNLDPHTAYMRADAFRRMRESVQGSYAGIGIVITLDEEGLIRIVSPIDGTPAARAGLKPNDRILQIDKDVMAGRPIGDAVTLMRGPVGDPVDITVRRGSAEPFVLTLRRARIEVPVVSSRYLGNGLGYVRISRFDGTTTKQFRDHLTALQSDRANPVTGMIVDLRRNPGGLLGEAVKAADLFLSDGVIVSTQGRDGRRIDTFKADRTQLLRGIPIVVLLDIGSASGAELMAAALRDNGRAVIFGETSFGKGSMQGLLTVDEHAALRLTIGYYATPSGEIVQGAGVEPDFEIRIQREELVQREGDLDGALISPTGRTGAIKASVAEAACPPVPEAALPENARDLKEPFSDPMLGCAISYLAGGPISQYVLR